MSSSPFQPPRHDPPKRRRASLRRFLGGLAAVLAMAMPVSAARGQSLPVYELSGGRWFTGTGFEPRTMFTVGGRLTFERPARVDSVIDLSGRWVVPAYGEGHTHRPDAPDRVEMHDRQLKADGVFYAMNQTNFSRFHDAMAARLAGPETIDVVFSNGLIASAQSHGVDLWNRIVRGGAYGEMTVEELDGDTYFIVETREDLDRKWDALLATRPDFIKVMLEYSEEWELRHDDRSYFGRTGLNRALIPEIVRRAHDAGLRVSAHIETAADFRVALDAGVDLIAHVPGYDIPAGDPVERFRLSPDDARRAAERGTIVIVTTLLSEGFSRDVEERRRTMRENHAENLRVLSDAGVTLALGSDAYNESSVDEAINVGSLGALEPVAILRALAMTTPRAIFPGRPIGVLEEGAEADLLALTADPLAALENLRAIGLRMKAGRLLSPSPAP